MWFIPCPTKIVEAPKKNKLPKTLSGGTPISDGSDFMIDSTFFNYSNLFLADAKIILDSTPVFQQLNLQKQLPLLQEQSEKSKYSPTVSIKGFLGANQFSNDFNPVKLNSWFG